MVEATDEIGVSASGERQLRRHWSGDASPWGTVLIVHGGGEHSARYNHVAIQMVEAGLDVHSFDWVGHGGSGGKRWHIDMYETYHDDLAERIARRESRTRRLCSTGIRWAGSLLSGTA